MKFLSSFDSADDFDRHKELLTRELLYTGIIRARNGSMSRVIGT